MINFIKKKIGSLTKKSEKTSPGKQDNTKDATIPFPFAEDWHNPNDALFNKMATTFESVMKILQDKGFLR